MSDSEWTVGTLREHVLRIVADQDKAVQAALAASEKAVSKAEDASTKRFESVNEFRQTLSDQTASFVTRTELDVQVRSISDKAERTAESLRSMTRALIGTTAAAAVAITVAIINFVS